MGRSFLPAAFFTQGATWNAEMFFQHLANGLIQGSLYALVAVGLTLVYGVLEVVNFAHGELYMLAAFALFMLFSFLKFPYLLAVFLTIVALMLLGYVLSRTAIVPHLRRSFETTVLATLAASIILQNGARFAFTATPRQVIVPLEDVILSIGNVIVTGQRLLVLFTAMVAFAGLQVYIRKSRTGKAMRAASQNKEACRMVGIDVRRIASQTMVLGAALCALAGAMVAPLYDIFPAIGTTVVFKSFAVVIMGGMGNVPGAMIAALILGLGESLAGGYISIAARDALGFSLMILVLLIRPDGFFGKRVRI